MYLMFWVVHTYIYAQPLIPFFVVLLFGNAEGSAAAGGGPFQGVQKDLFAGANTTTNGNGNAWDDTANDGDKEEKGK